MINFFLSFNRHGKVRLNRWFIPVSNRDKKKITSDAISTVISRKKGMCNIVEYKEYKLVYKRYASLYFLAAVDEDDNELITLEIIHRLVQILDEYFGNVCELDIIYGMQEAYMIMDELIISGELLESSKKSISRAIYKMNEKEHEEQLVESLKQSNLI